MTGARAALLLAAALGGCAEPETPVSLHVVGGDAQRGRAVIARIGCSVCHVVPGMSGPQGTVGPSLEGFGRRALIAGVAPNQPGRLTQWLRNAPSIAADTGMPDLPLTEAEARDVAAYLYTLR